MFREWDKVSPKVKLGRLAKRIRGKAVEFGDLKTKKGRMMFGSVQLLSRARLFATP